MLQTYTLENVADHDVTHVSLYQLMHAHPNDDYAANNYGVYDNTLYVDPDDQFSAHRYDMSFFAPLPAWQSNMDDVIGFSSTVEPDEWGLGAFPGHGGEPGPTSIHHLVEADTLPGGTIWGPDEIAGVMKWEFGALAPGDSVSLTVMFFTAHTESGVNPQVPVPGAILLAGIGVGVMSRLRRRRLL